MQQQRDIWTELKCKKNNITRRSAHRMVYYQERLYTYGGFELGQTLLEGLFSIGYSQGQLADEWERHQSNSPYAPQKLAYYIMAINEGTLYLSGGLCRATEISSRTYRYNLAAREWLSPIESQHRVHSHSAEVFEGRWVSAFGFAERDGRCMFTSEVLASDFKSDFEVLQVDGRAPQPRIHCASTVAPNGICFHGGINQDGQVLDDLRVLDGRKWSEVLYQPRIQRMRHTITYYKDALYLFAGSDQNIKETNTLYIIRQGMARQVTQTVPEQPNLRVQKALSRYKGIQQPFRGVSPSLVRKSFKPADDTITKTISMVSMLPNESPPLSKLSAESIQFDHVHQKLFLFLRDQKKQRVTREPHHRQYAPLRRKASIPNLPAIVAIERSRSSSIQKARALSQPSKDNVSDMSLEKRNRELQLQQIYKKTLYESLETPVSRKHLSKPWPQVQVTPTTSQMKNIILSVTDTLHWNQFAKTHIVEGDHSKLITAQVKQFIFRSRMPGHVPFERDGHACALLGSKLIVFGGDRNRLSFNDIFELEM